MKEKTVSVILSAYQRAQFLPWTIYSIINQEVKPDEIILVDDGSVDNTRHIMEKFIEEYPEVNIRYIYNHNPGWTICVLGKNIGIKAAKSEILLITDPEILNCTPSVKIAKEFFSKSENDRKILIGSPLYQVQEEAFNKLTNYELLNPIEIIKKPEVKEWHQGFVSKPNDITYFPFGGTHHMSAVLKKHMVAIGGYDEDFLDGGSGGYDDIDMITRLRLSGIEHAKTSEIISIHLYHDPPPLHTRKPEIVMKNYERMQARGEIINRKIKEGTLTDECMVNKGREWGVIKK